MLFADPAVARVYATTRRTRTSPRPTCTSGEISLECSAPAPPPPALWLTLQALPLERDEGLGAVLAAGRRAALDWAARLRSSDVLALHVEPELDIVTYLPRVGSLSALDAASGADPEGRHGRPRRPVFLARCTSGATRSPRAIPRCGRRRRRARAAQRAHEARARARGAVAARARRGPGARRAVTRRGLVALGDSITNGHGEPALGVPMQSWAQWLAEALALPFTKLARDGALARDVVAEQVPRLDGPYDVACLYVGVNDARSTDWDAGGYERGAARGAAALAACSERAAAVHAARRSRPPARGAQAARGERHRPSPSPATTAPPWPSSTTSRARRGCCPTRCTPPRAASSRSPTARPARWAPRGFRPSLIEVHRSRRARARFTARWGVMLARDLRRRASSACWDRADRPRRLTCSAGRCG